MLLARLDLLQHDLRAVLVAAPRSNVDCLAPARDVARGATRLGRKARLVHLSGGPKSSPDPEVPEESMRVEDIRDPEKARIWIEAFDGLSVVVGRGLLDDAATLLSVRCVQGVVVAARVGKTMRSDLREMRIQIEQAGGKVVGAIQLR